MLYIHGLSGFICLFLFLNPCALYLVLFLYLPVVTFSYLVCFLKTCVSNAISSFGDQYSFLMSYILCLMSCMEDFISQIKAGLNHSISSVSRKPCHSGMEPEGVFWWIEPHFLHFVVFNWTGKHSELIICKRFPGQVFSSLRGFLLSLSPYGVLTGILRELEMPR